MNSVISRLFRLPYMLLMGPIKGRAHQRYLGQMDAMAKRIGDRVHMDDEGLICIFGGPGTSKGRIAHRLRLHTSVPCFDEIRDPTVAGNWRLYHKRSGGKIAFVTVQAADKEDAEGIIRDAARRLGIGLPFSIYFVELPSMAESWGKPVIPGATGPDHGYGPTVTIEDLERDPKFAAQYRALQWPEPPAGKPALAPGKVEAIQQQLDQLKRTR